MFDLIFGQLRCHFKRMQSLLMMSSSEKNDLKKVIKNV